MLNAAASANLKTIPLRDQPLDACVEALHRGVLARPPSVPALDASALEVGTKATGRATIRRDRHGDYEDGTPNRGTLCSEFEHAGLALAVAYSFDGDAAAAAHVSFDGCGPAAIVTGADGSPEAVEVAAHHGLCGRFFARLRATVEAPGVNCSKEQCDALRTRVWDTLREQCATVRADGFYRSTTT